MLHEVNRRAAQRPDADPIDVDIIVNGQRHRAENVPGDTLLIDYLHEVLRLRGPKLSCGIGACAACKVAVRVAADTPYMPVLACFARLRSINGMELLTVEGVGTEQDPHPLQRAFLEQHAFQCGYSTPGFVMAGFILIDQLRHRPIPEASLERYVLDAIGGHICRCTGYVRYFDAICSVIRQQVAQHELQWAPASEPATNASIHFVVRKRSGNDLDIKQVFGWFETPKVEVSFERSGDFSTLDASLTVQFDDLRTGIQVRDLNLRQFFFDPYTGAQFTLSGAQYLDGLRVLGAARGAGAIPVVLEGQLALLGGTATPSIPIRSVVLLSDAGDGQLRIASSAPVALPLDALPLAVSTFAKEFGIHLDAVVDVGFDLVVDMGSD